ncbi:MAG TPA: nickel ABC transporter ATP-binding protein NikE [Actinophytocola sp.]|jgi:ABC-type glutathione transport system ATPase component|uniref:nickel ABC transporter ATP-binding protein NikE n=1 Tax=Actinophytocola sp. TaxID=1872138 RepID=UPI002DFDED24|nr:nickel ABC transporter ATP-binding protein NikE [Actinophytocola sp.]
MSLLELRDVSVSYAGARGSAPAVHGVNLRLDPGEKLGLAGESGCGKSTLALSVLRLLPRTARIGGEILLDGEDVRTMSWGRLRAVRWASASVVFQGAMHALNPVRKVGDQIAEPILLHGAPGPVRTQVAELLSQVELAAAKANAYPHELSGGQKQRVMIAMALACRPRLVIADEPTTALDVIVQSQILDLLSRLVAEHHLGLIMISHDLAVLSATCDRLAIMYRGELVEEGDSRTLLHNPRHPHTTTLVAAFPTVGDPTSRYAPATTHTPDPESPPELPSEANPSQRANLREAPTTPGGRAPARHQRTSGTSGAGVEDQDGTGCPQGTELSTDPPLRVDELPGMEVSTDPLLKVDELRVTFHGRQREVTHAVAGVSLEVFPGEIVALVGQSGSGKTTLARTILGLQRPTAGRVIFDGEPVPTSSAGLRAYRRQVQLVLQDPTSALNPRHSVYEAVAEGLRIHRIPGDERARVAAALSSAELRPPEEFMPVLPQHLSGGQRQRVVIAGALALEPRLLVADEPVASLDASLRGEILALLLRLRERLGLAALVITHDLGLAWNIADRVAVMHRGSLVEVGAVEEVLANPQHAYTRALLAALPDGMPAVRTS